MATKTLTITEDAYDRLAVLKEGNESFSDVIRKLTKKKTLADLVGILNPADAEELKRNIEYDRKKIERDIDKSIKRLL